MIVDCINISGLATTARQTGPPCGSERAKKKHSLLGVTSSVMIWTLQHSISHVSGVRTGRVSPLNLPLMNTAAAIARALRKHRAPCVACLCKSGFFPASPSRKRISPGSVDLSSLRKPSERHFCIVIAKSASLCPEGTEKQWL